MSDDGSKIVRLVPDVVGDEMFIASDQILSEALGKYTECVVIGRTESGEIQVAGSRGREWAVFLMEAGKLQLVSGGGSE